MKTLLLEKDYENNILYRIDIILNIVTTILKETQALKNLCTLLWNSRRGALRIDSLHYAKLF